MSDWVALCRERAREAGLPAATAHLLDAFDRRPLPVRQDTWPALLEACRADLPDLAARVRGHLAQEVDAAQAAMFARRLTSVAGLLEELGEPVGSLFIVGLVRRVTEVLADQAPRALRVRAVVDYFYSRAAVELHADGPGRPYAELLDAVRWADVGPGVRHALLDGPGPLGPLHVNLLAVRDRRLHAVDDRPTGDLVARVRAEGAMAGVSGGFFLYSEPDIAPPCRRTDPVGLFVSAGEVVNPPVFARGALLQDPDGRVHIDRLGLPGCRFTHAGRTVEVTPGVAFTRADGPEAPTSGLLVVGRTVVGHGRVVPVGGFVLLGLDAPVGATLDVDLPRAVHTGIAGGPILVAPDGPVRDLHLEDFRGSAPPITFSQDETYDQNLLPRMAAGLRDDGTLLFAAVDGRNLERAPGLTLAATAELLAAAGCTVAVNLDGGSSKRMVVGDRVVDLPSTEVVAGATEHRVRPVHTALLVL
ncbi:MAG: phosphodiester glycosidase family protein [Alphaproteobacteria bacterium]|nr:phosphodiester glycosidase family protein [Alphaproteobacteria bacterium]